MKYRKKPVVIDAFHFTSDWMAPGKSVPIWFVEAMKKEGTGPSSFWKEEDGVHYIGTLEGPLIVSLNDYIIQGVQGELYPCKPDIFEATYELVE